MRNQQIYSQKAKSYSYQSRIDIVNTVYSAKRFIGMNLISKTVHFLLAVNH